MGVRQQYPNSVRPPFSPMSLPMGATLAHEECPETVHGLCYNHVVSLLPR